jgi:hypothetical protein
MFKSDNYVRVYIEDEKKTHGRAKNNKIFQTFMIHIGETFHLVVDKTAIHLPDKFENAFDVFFKSIFVFNVKYPLLLSNFFNFLEV